MCLKDGGSDVLYAKTNTPFHIRIAASDFMCSTVSAASRNVQTEGTQDLPDCRKKMWYFLDGDEGNVSDIDTIEDIETLKRRGHNIEES